MLETLNKGFRIPKGELEERIKIHVSFPVDYDLVPLKQIIKACRPPIILEKNEIIAFLKNMPLVNACEVKPFAKAKFRFYSTDPRGLYSPQSFVLASKIAGMLNAFDILYEDYNFPGLANRPAHYVIGIDRDGNKRVALYVPPLVEINEEDLLFDGLHRSTICGGVGATIGVIGIHGSTVDPPYKGVPWKINVVNKKPPLKERYVEFNPALLKDFGYVGIDG